MEALSTPRSWRGDGEGTCRERGQHCSWSNDEFGSHSSKPQLGGHRCGPLPGWRWSILKPSSACNLLVFQACAKHFITRSFFSHCRVTCSSLGTLDPAQRAGEPSSLRNNLTASLNGDALIQAVAARNNNTIVVINLVGLLILEPWVDHPNVTAIVFAGLRGTEIGNALVDVVYGAKNPSGRLPYTIARSPSDYPAQLVEGGNGEEILNITYSEGRVLFFCLFPPQITATYSQPVCRLSPP